MLGMVNFVLLGWCLGSFKVPTPQSVFGQAAPSWAGLQELPAAASTGSAGHGFVLGIWQCHFGHLAL